MASRGSRRVVVGFEELRMFFNHAVVLPGIAIRPPSAVSPSLAAAIVSLADAVAVSFHTLHPSLLARIPPPVPLTKCSIRTASQSVS